MGEVIKTLLYSIFFTIFLYIFFSYLVIVRSVQGGIMKSINKGEKAEFNGFILTNKEYNNYKKLLELVSLFKSCKQDYDRVYRSYLM